MALYGVCMSYIVSGGLFGVGVEVAQQAVRPREPPPPSPKVVTSSPEMYSRQLRPREAPPASKVLASKYLSQVAAAKGKQSELESLLKKLKIEASACKANEVRVTRTNNRALMAAAQEQTLRVQQAIAECISLIKQCAEKANVAASSAMAVGVAPVVVKEVSVQATKPVSAPVDPITTIAPAVIMPSSPSTVSVESSTAAITPGGEVVVGPDAVVVSTPSLNEPGAQPQQQPGEQTFQAQDVTVSSGSIGTVALVAAAAVLGYFVLKKKGHA